MGPVDFSKKNPSLGWLSEEIKIQCHKIYRPSYKIRISRFHGKKIVFEFLSKTGVTRSGVRTHADIRPLELKSNALTTRPSWLLNTGESLKVVALYTVIDSSRITGCFLVNFLHICVYLRSEKRYSTESRLLLLKPSLSQGMNIPIFLLKVW